MARQGHYAVLLGIDYYPGIRNLAGPGRDVMEFRNWLMKPTGGDVDPENIKVIKSSDYAQVADPNDANPTEGALKKALDQLVRPVKNQWKAHVGERLYLYMAGHGFTAGSSISDPALFSAVAQQGDTAHIAGYRYAAKIVSAKFFDEVVLVMDCCQDVLKASQVLEPTWSPPDRGGAAQVKFLQAYGAPRGQAAFETEDPPGSHAVRGNFSKVLIEALDTALPDDGFVTGLTLKNQVLQIWGERYRAQTSYDPPIRPPDGPDIKLFPRGSAAAKLMRFEIAPPVPANAQLRITGSGDFLDTIPVSALTPRQLRPGLYKAVLTLTTRELLFEVTGAEERVVQL